MNSTTVAAATAPALTTPFVVPASCTDVFNTTITYRAGFNGDATQYTVYAAFPQTTGGCQASGANVLRDGATMIVRPGVCPSDWVAYNLKVDDPQYYPNPSDSASVTFKALCCSSGFSATGTVNDMPSFGPACTKLVSKTQGVTSRQTTTTLTVSAHAAWQIDWMASDAPTLTPQPPSMELCYDVQIPTWTPGAEATGRKKCKSLKESPDKHQYDGLIYVAIVLPSVIGFLLIKLDSKSLDSHFILDRLDPLWAALSDTDMHIIDNLIARAFNGIQGTIINLGTIIAVTCGSTRTSLLTDLN
ncbi:hypothetical protein MY11210_005106 [Beauveria gryllotalpidicola]